ncbi:MAG TPA: hypothetical protein VM900_07905 [Sphingomonas sp.]|jgi:hypothetical protein|nr:hypothetical protein [Sphingomonas sp.]
MAQVLDRQVIVRDFVKAGATSAAAAIAYQPPEARVFRQLRAFGAIVDAGGARFYLDAERLAAFRRATRRRTAAATATGMLASMAAVLQVLEL